MKLGAIDIGSNAIRLQVTNVIETKNQTNFKKVEYVRFPLRLGHDVFTDGKISKSSREKFIQLMQAFKILLDLYEVDKYFACATSAMRESENGEEIVKEVKDKLGLKINIIDGLTEATLINNAINSFLDEDTTYLHIDVGGGSTELNLYHKGEKSLSKSFKIGSVRRLEHHDSPEIWSDMKKWVKEHIKKRPERIVAVGTGGNINKIFELAGSKPGKVISLHTVKEVIAEVEKLSYKERMVQLQLNSDRADVIVPASEIYISVMEWAKANDILVPNVGLKDGILLKAYAEVKNIDVPLL